MDKQVELRKIVAELLEVDAAQVGTDTKLTGQRLKGSLGRSILDAAIRRRIGVNNPSVYLVKSFGELEAAILGSSSPVPAPKSVVAPVASASIPAGLSCGVDIEMVSRLPSVTDYREADYYRTHFTKAEAEYCLSQDDPRPHFAARWCAKEALKKCDSRYLSTDFGSIEVILDLNGRPSLRAQSGGVWMALPHALSLSHTPEMAIAFVVLAASAGHLPANR